MDRGLARATYREPLGPGPPYNVSPAALSATATTRQRRLHLLAYRAETLGLRVRQLDADC
jgi:hypothetical protein